MMFVEAATMYHARSLAAGVFGQMGMSRSTHKREEGPRSRILRRSAPYPTDREQPDQAALTDNKIGNTVPAATRKAAISGPDASGRKIPAWIETSYSTAAETVRFANMPEV